MNELHRRLRNANRLVLFAALATVILSVYFLWSERRSQVIELRAAAGDVLGRRYQIAKHLADELQPLGVALTLVPTAGSEEALAKLQAGELDIALVQGGEKVGSNVRLVGALYPEPLHLLVRPGLEVGGFGTLRGKKLNLSRVGSGTRVLAEKVLAFAGLQKGRDFTEDSLSYADILKLPETQLPDAIFMVSSLPSDVAQQLIQSRGYVLKSVPFGEALFFRDFSIQPTTIPPRLYRADPDVPAEKIETLGNMLLVVANEKVPQRAITKVLRGVFEGSLARTAEIPYLNPETLDLPPEIEPHEGMVAYRDRNNPVVTSEAIDNIESLRSFVVSSLVALFFFWRWWERRKCIGFEKYLDEVTRTERAALELEMKPTLDLDQLLRLRHSLSELKSDALEKYIAGTIKGEELLAGFLTHVTDVRNYLNALILHERQRMEKAAAKSNASPDEKARMEKLWVAAVGDFTSDLDEPDSEK